MKNLSHLLYDKLVKYNLSQPIAEYINMLVLCFCLIIIVISLDFLIRKFLLTTISKFAQKTKSKFDDILVANRVSRNIAHIIPLFLAIKVLPYILADFSKAEYVITKCLKVLGVFLALWIVRSLLNALKDYFKTLPKLKDKPIDSYIQVFMIFAWLIGLITSYGVIDDNVNLDSFFTKLGAASAIIILIFRDSILGFVASIQVSINDMVRIGDWVTMDKYGADGDVVEINLSTVKVQNFDKTITTIPTYALISDSFRNWRGMANSDGRRIKRAINIKIESIKYLNNEEIDVLKEIHLISDYLTLKKEAITDYNTSNAINKNLLINGRNLTNIGVFRKYIDVYLNQHSAINKDMIVMTRQLSPTTQGIPLEIYAFSKDKRWENYEYIIADIFDHLIAAIPYFNLEIFEQPNSKSYLNKV